MVYQEEVQKLFETFLTENPIAAVLSGQLEKTEFLKMRLHPVLLGETMMFQAEEFRGKQAFHKNMDRDQAAGYLTGLMGTSFKQAQLETADWTASVLVSKKGKATIKVKKRAEAMKHADVE